MQIAFTKMQGAGNDFIVLDETRGLLGLTPAHYRWLADRHFGVGADQILSVRPSPGPGVDFEYLIHNADGGEVQQCGNGARCFARYVYDKGLTTKRTIRVQTLSGVIAPQLGDDGRVRVDMGPPRLLPDYLPFDPKGLTPRRTGGCDLWPLDMPGGAIVQIAVVSMGNPHAVLLVDDVDTAPVAQTAPSIEHHWRFAQRVNVGYLQVQSPFEARLRVHERGAGETLACGTGACAAVVAGILQGLLAARVDVHTHGGLLTIEWNGQPGGSVFLTGPAITVFEGSLTLPTFDDAADGGGRLCVVTPEVTRAP